MSSKIAKIEAAETTKDGQNFMEMSQTDLVKHIKSLSNPESVFIQSKVDAQVCIAAVNFANSLNEIMREATIAALQKLQTFKLNQKIENNGK